MIRGNDLKSFRIIRISLVYLCSLILTTTTYASGEFNATSPFNLKNNLVAEPQATKVVSRTEKDIYDNFIPGVTIIVKGTRLDTVNNIEGKYSFSNLPDKATLIFSLIGMVSQEISVSNQTAIKVTLLEDNIGLEEVIAIGYGTQTKYRLLVEKYVK